VRARLLTPVLGAAVVLGPTFAESDAWADAHEGISLFPPTGTMRAGVETETTGFLIDGQRGSFISGVPRIEYTPLHLMNLRVRVPFHSLALDGETTTRNGIGDMELRLRLNLKRAEPLRISAGWVIQMPTGSKHEGLGEGAVQITPFVNAGLRIDKVIVYLTVADTMSLAFTHEPRLTNYVDPGTDHEVRSTLGTIIPVSDVVSAGAIFTETTILTQVQRWDSLLTGGLQLGVQPDPRIRVVASEQLPLLGEHRFSWKLNAAVTYAF
jgi:hypothetical protein